MVKGSSKKMAKAASKAAKAEWRVDHALHEARMAESQDTWGELSRVAELEFPTDTGNVPNLAKKLWSMLSWEADSNNKIIDQMSAQFEDRGPLVEVRESEGNSNGNGVFATVNIPKNTMFTTYPCSGLLVPCGTMQESADRRARNEPGDRCFISPMLSPLLPEELNLNYALNIPIFNSAGRSVQIVGHPFKCHGMACGHRINDAFTPDQVGGAEAYGMFDATNCAPQWDDGTVLMMTTRDVPMGQELLFSYGAAHWTDPVSHDGSHEP